MDKSESLLQSESPHMGRTIRVVSFGYKKANPPHANMLFDVRFLKNPFWVEELRPLTGLDLPVRRYVMEQDAANAFLANLLQMLDQVLPLMFETKATVFTIALGCTGGQHRSVSVAETLAGELKERFKTIDIELSHRELEERMSNQMSQALEGGVA